MTSVRGRTTGLLLAGGAGRRFGGPKALAVDAAGTPWVARAALTLLDGGCAEALVVTGAEAEVVEARLEALGDARVAVVRCGTWQRGMGESLRAGLAALAARGRAAPPQALVHLVDLPDVGPEVVARVLEHAGEGSDALVRAAYLGLPGHPVLLGRDHWEAVVADAHGDQGARRYLRAARPLLVECGDLASGTDVDRRT